MSTLTRRLFLRHTAAAGAASATAVVPAVAAEPAMTAREQVIMHMREIERLVIADSGEGATVIVMGKYEEGRYGMRSLAIHPDGRLVGLGRMLPAEGGSR